MFPICLNILQNNTLAPRYLEDVERLVGSKLAEEMFLKWGETRDPAQVTEVRQFFDDDARDYLWHLAGHTASSGRIFENVAMLNGYMLSDGREMFKWTQAPEVPYEDQVQAFRKLLNIYETVTWLTATSSPDMTLVEIPRIEPPPPPSSMLTILADDAKEIALRTGVKRVREKMSDLLGGFLRSKGMEESAITTLLTSDYGQGIVSYLVGFSYELVKEDGGDSKIQEFVGSVLGELRIQAGVLIADEVINDLLNPVVSTLRTEIPMGAEKVRVIETPMGDSVEEETLVLPPQSSLTS